jgi:hypothetical protein
MMKNGFLAGLCAAMMMCALMAGCDSGSVNVPEERVVTKESSEDMMKQLEASRKAMGKPPAAAK